MLGDPSRARRDRISQRIAILALATAFALGWAAESVPPELPPQ
jgi:hypothetical protein